MVFGEGRLDDGKRGRWDCGDEMENGVEGVDCIIMMKSEEIVTQLIRSYYFRGSLIWRWLCC